MNDIADNTNLNQLNQANQPLSIGSDGNSGGPKYIDHLEKNTNSAKMLYYLWISRFFVLTAVVSMSFLILASLVLFRLAPRVTVEPLLLINNSDSENLVSSESISYDMPSRDLLMKMYIKQYVVLRNTIIHDTIEMQSRWMAGGMLNFLSSRAVYNEFGNTIGSKWEKIVAQPLTREVDITSVTRQGGDRSPIWKVDFKTYDLPNTRGTKTSADAIKVRYWTSSIIAKFIPERAFSFRRLINPLGFTVTRYSQTEVNIF